MIRTAILLLSVIVTLSCNDATNSLTKEQITGIEKNVKALADSISKNVSQQGPSAWLHYFDNSPDFFMVNDGQIVFPNIDSAKNFVTNTLVKTYQNIELQLSNIRVKVASNEFAIVAANYHENNTYSDGNKLTEDGYLTALAHQTAEGWKLQNLHWSSLVKH